MWGRRLIAILAILAIVATAPAPAEAVNPLRLVKVLGSGAQVALTAGGTVLTALMRMFRWWAPDSRRMIAAIQADALGIQGVIIGRQTDIDALRNSDVIRGVMRPVAAVPQHLRRLPEGRVVIVAEPPLAAELFNRLKPPQVRTRILHSYSNGEATISAACDLCEPTATIGYGDGHISFTAGCRNGVTMEVSTTGDFKGILSKGPVSVAVGVKADADYQHTAVNDVINSPASVSLSASQGCRNGVETAELQVSVTAVGLTVSASEVAEADDVSEGIFAPVETTEVDDEDLTPDDLEPKWFWPGDVGSVDSTHQALMETLWVEIEAVEWPEDVDSVEIAEFVELLKNRGELDMAELAWKLPTTRNSLLRKLTYDGPRLLSNREFLDISTEEMAVLAFVTEVALMHESVRRCASVAFGFLATQFMRSAATDFRKANGRASRGAGCIVQVWGCNGPVVEEGLGLDRAARREIQEGLQAGGFDPGVADGLLGPQTRAGIRRWQTSRGARATGYLDAASAEALRPASVAPRTFRERLGAVASAPAAVPAGQRAATAGQPAAPAVSAGPESLFWQSIANSTISTTTPGCSRGGSRPPTCCPGGDATGRGVATAASSPARSPSSAAGSTP